MLPSAVHFVYPTVLKAFATHHQHRKYLVGFLCPVDMDVVKLTSSTNLADHHIVRYQAFYNWNMCPHKIELRLHYFHENGGLSQLPICVETRDVDIKP